MSATQSHPDCHVAIDELDSAIVTLAARINASSYELLVLIRRFDERAGWLKWGFANCSDWLHWRCDLSVSASGNVIPLSSSGTPGRIVTGTEIFLLLLSILWSRVDSLKPVSARRILCMVRL